MKGYSSLKKAGLFFVLAVLLLALAVPVMIGLLPLQPVSASNPVAISGNFYTQKFVIPVGGSIDVSSVYVVAFNQGTEAANFIVSYTTEAPDVSLNLSETEFVLNPAQSKEVQVGVYVGLDASPGLYDITVNVRAERETTEGVQTLGSAEEVASLSIVGEAGNVRVETVSPRGGRVVTHIRLWKVIDGEQYEFADSVTGLLEKTVSPGHYVAKAFSMSVELASDEFDVAHLEEVSRTLTVETIYFKFFEPTLARNPGTGAPAYAQMVYTIANVYQAVADASVNLVVKFEGADLEIVPNILVQNPLYTGDTGVPYQYLPSAGWEDGTYSFQLELYVGGQLYARSEEKPLDVGLPSGRSMLWLWILLGVVGAAGLGFLIFFLLKRRRKEEEKPRKAEKKAKEEKPAPKAKEPVRRPETTKPPEPLRPVQPVRPPPAPVEEPMVEPAPLASISTLKARMASLGRDQSTGQPDEEGETEAEEQANVTDTSEEFDVVPLPLREEKPPTSGKTPGQKPSIYSSVTATPKEEPPKPPSDIQINWPPRAAESTKPSSFAEAARQRAAAQQPVSPIEEGAPEEETAGEEPAEPEAPPSRSSFAEAARLRMEARQRATEAGEEDSLAEDDGSGEPGEGEGQPPSQ